MSDATPRPTALLLIAPGCPHCGAVLQSAGQLIKEGAISRLEVVNIGVAPEQAQFPGVRSVPWMRIGPFELEGAHTADELREWAGLADRPEGMSRYFAMLLRDRRQGHVRSMVQTDPRRLPSLVGLLEDLETGVDVRLGIGAVLEDLGEDGVLAAAVPALGRLSRHANPRVRADAIHYLALTSSATAVPYTQALLNDPDPIVREIAAETLEALGQTAGSPEP